jgi:hypothetical protein
MPLAQMGEGDLMQGCGLFLLFHAEEVGPVGDIDPTITAQNQGVPVWPTIRSGAYLSVGVTTCVVLQILGWGNCISLPA